MKNKYNFSLIQLWIFLSALSFNHAYSQTASDYFIPLCSGNYLELKTTSHYTGTDSLGWEPRYTWYKVLGTATWNGKTYYLHKGIEVPFSNTADSSVFQRMWFREDQSGNILMGAYTEKESDNPDSANVLPSEWPYFTNAYLTAGYSNTYIESPGVTSIDSVLSTTVTVGTYTNCIQVRSTRRKNGVLDLIDDYYYAYKVGIVKATRNLPYYQVHEDDILAHLSNECNSAIEENVGGQFNINVYPNPSVQNLTIQTNQPIKARVAIFSSSGQLLYEEHMNGNLMIIPTHTFPSGICFYIVESDQSIISKGIILINP